MRTIETNAIVTEDGNLIVALPKNIVPGEHRVVITIDEQPVVKGSKPPLKFRDYQVGLVDPNFTFRREDL